MERVLGVGGAFVRARDREALARWYAEHLGVQIDESWWGAAFPLSTPEDNAGACVVFGVFAQETGYFGDRANAYMLNFRVRDLHAMLTQLRDAECDIADRVELWEPPDTPRP